MSAQKFLLLRADINRTLTQIATVVAEGRETLEGFDGLATEMGDVWERFHDEMEAFKDVLRSLHAGCS